ncbi:MAG: hypothetical protein GF388_06990 [Candidatus Aegiribacteria sp.]|nr:hypothetical protein [Candidatus Aegiribacteria sp.]
MPRALLDQFNRLGDVRKSLIQKALDSATGTGEALIPEKLEEIITNTVVRLAPEIAVIKPEYDAQKFHEYNQLTSLPSAGGAMGEGATTPTRNAQYARKSVELKVVRRKGSVTNFLQDTSRNYIDASAAEMENHMQAHVYDLITYILFGNANGDGYTFDGLDYLVSTNRFNEAVGGSVPTSLNFLDDMIDLSNEKQGSQHDRVFVMSPRMLSKVSQLLTNVRLTQGLSAGGMSQVEVNGGWRLNAYRDIPIIESGSTRPQGTMGSITLADSGSGGAITDATYYFRVSYVGWNGESLASAENSISTTNADDITVSWSAETGAMFYKIYCATSSGSEKLVRVISAFNYDASGTISSDVTEYVFTSDPDSSDDSVTTAMESDVPLVSTGGVPPEYLMLWDLDKYQGLGKFPYTNAGGSRFRGLVTAEDLAKTDDFLPFLIKTYGALCPSFEETSVVWRGYRVA